MSVIPRIWLSRCWWVGLLFAPGLALAAPFAYITNAISSTVSVIDTASNAVVATIAVGPGPGGVAVNPTGTRVYVANVASDSLSIIDTARNAVVATVPVGASPSGVAVNSAGTRVYVANLDSKNVSVIDTATNTVVATVTVGTSPAGIAVNPAGSRIYVANGDSNSISVIDAATNVVVATIVNVSSPEAIAVHPAGTRLYVSMNTPDGVAIIDTDTNAIVGSVGVGATPTGIAVNPAGTRVYAANSDSKNVSVIDTTTNTAVATVAVGTTPVGIAVNPAGTRAYVANFDSNSVSVIDTATNTVIATVAVGVEPVAFGLFIGPAAVTANNYQGLWWAAGGTESGWGINFAHQGEQIFATWYTYDTTRKAWWLTMLAARTTPTGNAYAGTIYTSSGPSFNNFTGTTVPTAVGSGTLMFADANTGSFAYTVNGVSETKAITRFDLGTGPQVSCTYSATTPNFAAATNYQDLWWNAAEPGWGINFAQQGGSIFATWYTYNADHSPLWLSALVQRQGATNVYSGAMYQNSGSRFDAFNPAQVMVNPVGTATLTFADGANATFGYSVMVAPFPGPVTQSTAITRFPFAASGGTVCQ